MTQDRLSNDEFLSRLTILLSSTNTSNHGSVFLTQKPLITSPTTATPDSPATQILIRATNGATSTKLHPKKPKSVVKTTSSKSKQKFSTVVDVAELDGFYVKYADVCKKGMEGMRKRDKKKAKEKAKAKKKAAAAATSGVAS